MNKKKIIIISTIILLLLIFTLIIKFTNNSENILVKYLKASGFTNNENTSLFKRQISKITEEELNNNINNNINSEYEMQYFNTNTFEYTKDKISYNNNITKYYTPTYNYRDNKITYIYKINYQNANIIVKGEYNLNNKKFICEPTFYYQMNIEKVKDNICNKIKLETEIFSNEITTLIENPKALNHIKNNIS